MAVPQTQQELLQAIQTTYAKLVADLATVPPERAREVTLEGHAKGTLMSIADLVAYLVGWNELGRLAQTFYADRADLSFPVLLQHLADVNARIVALVASGTDASLYGCDWYRTYTKGRMIQLNTSSPYSNAHTRLRKWLRAQGI